MKNIKVLIIGDSKGSFNYQGGTTIFHNTLVEGLRKVHNLVVCDPREKHINKSKVVQVFHVLKEYFSFKPHVVILATFGYHYILFFILKLFSNIKIIVVFHSLAGTSVDEKIKFSLSIFYFRMGLFRNILEKSALHIATIKIFPSLLFLQKAKEAKYSVTRAKIIPHGIFSNSISSKIRNNSDKEKDLAIIGGLWENKGINKLPLILKALPVGAKLRWLGYNPTDKMQVRKKEIVDKHNYQDFVILEAVPHFEVISFLDSTSILLIPSEFETFSLAVLEACARRLPVIISENVGMSKAISDFKAGIIINFNSFEEIKNAIDEILNNYHFYSRNAFLLSNNYVWDKVIQQYVAVIEEIV